MYENCFALSNGKCKILTERLCKNCKCHFYKSKEQYKADTKKYPALTPKELMRVRSNG